MQRSSPLACLAFASCVVLPPLWCTKRAHYDAQVTFRGKVSMSATQTYRISRSPLRIDEV